MELSLNFCPIDIGMAVWSGLHIGIGIYYISALYYKNGKT